jgi:hypothetical protein
LLIKIKFLRFRAGLLAQMLQRARKKKNKNSDRIFSEF